MNSIKKYITYKSVSGVLVVLLIAAAAILYLNQGFYFTYYHPTFLIEVNSDAADQVLNDFALREGVSRIDRENNTLELQALSEAEARNLATEIESREDVTSTTVSSEQLVIPRGIQQRLITGIGTVLLATLGFFYYIYGRKFAKKNTRTTYLSGFFVGLAIYTALFIQAGVLSALSRFYVLTEVSFISILLSFLWGSTIIMFTLREAVGDIELAKMPSLQEVFKSLNNQVANVYGQSFLIWSFILVGLVLGLGANFFVDAVLIALGLAVMLVSISVLPRFYHYLFSTSLKFRFTTGRSKKVTSKTGKKKQFKEKHVASRTSSNETSKTQRKLTKSEKKKRSSSRPKPRNRK